MGATIAQFAFLPSLLGAVEDKPTEVEVKDGDKLWNLVVGNKAKLSLAAGTSPAKIIGKSQDWSSSDKTSKFNPGRIVPGDIIEFSSQRIKLTRTLRDGKISFTRDLSDLPKSDFAPNPQEVKFPNLPAPAKKDEFKASGESKKPSSQETRVADWVKKYARVFEPPPGTTVLGTIIIDPGHGKYMKDLSKSDDDHYDSGASYHFKRNAQGVITETKHDGAVSAKAAKSYTGRADEAVINLLIANDTAAELAKQGYRVIVTRKDQYFAGYKGEGKMRLGTATPDREGILADIIDVYKPVAIVDQQGNADPDPSTKGHRGYCRRSHTSSRQMCEAVQLELFEGGLTKHDYDKRARNESETQHDTIRVARLAFEAGIPGIMTENGFISSPSDLQVLLENRDLPNTLDRKDIARAIATGLIKSLEPVLKIQ
ncbi:MAG: N-acetylmuramoyl-L-alanine amidase [Candidatus Melainabacteria bacterium]|nr:N-acetylmuramoyl-L-alanine amidase [Candidatus Melainabacteria bacterium]